MQAQITQITLKKDTSEIRGERSYPNGLVEWKFTVGGTEISPELVAAMSRLLNTLCGFCCLGEEWDEGEITGVTFYHTGDGTGLVITGQLRVEDEDGVYVAVVNSPYISPNRLLIHQAQTVHQVLQAATDWMEALSQQQHEAIYAQPTTKGVA